jgi:hypothetical protein
VESSHGGFFGWADWLVTVFCRLLTAIVALTPPIRTTARRIPAQSRHLAPLRLFTHRKSRTIDDYIDDDFTDRVFVGQYRAARQRRLTAFLSAFWLDAIGSGMLFAR